jgi:hypothetical protein
MAELEAALASSKREAERLRQELNLECSENKSRGLLQHLMDEKAKRVRTRTSQDRTRTEELRTQLTALEVQASTPWPHISNTRICTTGTTPQLCICSFLYCSIHCELLE